MPKVTARRRAVDAQTFQNYPSRKIVAAIAAAFQAPVASPIAPRPVPRLNTAPSNSPKATRRGGGGGLRREVADDVGGRPGCGAGDHAPAPSAQPTATIGLQRMFELHRLGLGTRIAVAETTHHRLPKCTSPRAAARRICFARSSRRPRCRSVASWAQAGQETPGL